MLPNGFPAKSVLTLCLLALALLQPATAPAWQVDLFPLFLHGVDGESDERVTAALWPLIEWRAGEDRTLRAVRPLWAWERRDSEGWRELDILWPLVNWRHDRIGDPEGERRRLRILPIVHWKRHENPLFAPWRLTIFPLVYAGRTDRDPEHGYLIVFPFWWQARGTRVFFPIYWSSEESFSAVFPLWGRFQDLWGRKEVRFVLFPLWSRSRRECGAVIDSVLWPIFAWCRGGPYHGLRMWPLFGYSREEGEWAEGFFLWPLGHFRRATLPDGRPNNLTFFFPTRFKWEIGNTRLDVRWPLWGTYETPGRRTWSLAWPLWMHTDNWREGWIEDRLLWIVGRWRRGETESALELLPLVGRRDSPGRSLRYVLFPFYTRIRREFEDRTRDITLLLPLFVHTRTEWPNEEDWRLTEIAETRWVFPLFLHRRERSGAERTDWLWPLFITESRGYQRSWGALFRIIEMGREEDGTRWLNVLWRLYRREVDPDDEVHSEYNGLIVRRERTGEWNRLSFFGPLIERTSDLDGADWSWFNFGGRASTR